MPSKYQPFEDTCLHCFQPVLITRWDDMAGLETDRIRLDPTPLTLQQQIACVVIGRRTYLIEETATGTWRTSQRGSWEASWPEPVKPIATIPEHKCGATFPSAHPLGKQAVPFIPDYAEAPF